MYKLKEKIRHFLKNDFFSWFLAGLIIISLGVYVIEHLNLSKEQVDLAYRIEKIIVVFFFIEYVTRIFVEPKPLKFILSPLGLVDLLVVLPLFVNAEAVTFLRGFRLLELFHLLKIVRYSGEINQLWKATVHYRKEFKFFFSFFAVVYMISAFGIYALESSQNPSINSFGEAFWWAVVTISTVGYGDITPITAAGRIFSGAVIFFGISMIAILTALVTKIVVVYLFDQKIHECASCGEKRHHKEAVFCYGCGTRINQIPKEIK